MKNGLRSKYITDFVWVFLLLLSLAMAEYSILILFDLHFILSINAQVLLGLFIIGYGVHNIVDFLGLFKVFDIDQEGLSPEGIELKSDFR